MAGIFNKLPKHMWDVMIFPGLNMKDVIRFGAVCRFCRCIAAEIQRNLHPLPWLMISRDEHTGCGTFLSISDNRIYTIKVAPPLSLYYDENFICGSTDGLLVVATRSRMFLFNPFSQIWINLPNQYVPNRDTCSHHKRYYFTKGIILANNCSSHGQYVVSVLSFYLQIIEMCRSQDPEWPIFGEDKDNSPEYEIRVIEDGTRVKIFPEYDDDTSFSDILFYQGKLYGVTKTNRLFTFELPAEEDWKQPLVHTILNVEPMSRPTDPKYPVVSNYLAESLDHELLMVYRFGTDTFAVDAKITTKNFLVFKLDQSNDDEVFRWIPLHSLGDQMLFLGRNSSLSFSGSACACFPRLFKGNCIYFSDDKGYNSLDNGVFNLDDGSIEALFSVANVSYSYKYPPVWVTPNAIRGI